MINSQTLQKFQKDLGSKSPTPGGGVVSALTASFATSLVEMVCNLTIDKKGYEKVQKDIIKFRKDAIEMIMAGATAVGIGTGIYYRGIGIFKKVCDEMISWMKRNKVKSLNEIRGAGHK